MKRKIFIFSAECKATIYGIGTYIEELTNCLKGSDLDLTIVYINDSSGLNKIKEYTIIDYGYFKKISIPSVLKNGNTDFLKYSRDVIYLLRDIVGKEDNMEYVFHLNFMADTILIKTLRKLFKCKIILTVHYLNWALILNGSKNKLMKILKTPSSYLDSHEHEIINKIEDDKSMISNCDLCICIAKHTLDTFINIYNLHNNELIVVNNALKDKFIKHTLSEKNHIKTKYFINKKTKIIVFAGRLEDIKGVLFLISAFKTVLLTNPNIHLFICGNGLYDKWIYESKTYWSKISFTGRLDKKELYELYSIADIGIVCSLYEEFGYVSIEMMMHEIPLIVTDTGGLSEIIEDNIDGIKIPISTNDDELYIKSDVLADKIRLLLNNSSISKKIRNNARKKFLEKYEIKIFKNKMINIYNSI